VNNVLTPLWLLLHNSCPVDEYRPAVAAAAGRSSAAAVAAPSSKWQLQYDEHCALLNAAQKPIESMLQGSTDAAALWMLQQHALRQQHRLLQQDAYLL
jgi:hypothetical protein